MATALTFALLASLTGTPVLTTLCQWMCAEPAAAATTAQHHEHEGHAMSAPAAPAAPARGDSSAEDVPGGPLLTSQVNCDHPAGVAASAVAAKVGKHVAALQGVHLGLSRLLEASSSDPNSLATHSPPGSVTTAVPLRI